MILILTIPQLVFSPNFTIVVYCYLVLPYHFIVHYDREIEITPNYSTKKCIINFQTGVFDANLRLHHRFTCIYVKTLYKSAESQPAFTVHKHFAVIYDLCVI